MYYYDIETTTKLVESRVLGGGAAGAALAAPIIVNFY